MQKGNLTISFLLFGKTGLEVQLPHPKAYLALRFEYILAALDNGSGAQAMLETLQSQAVLFSQLLEETSSICVPDSPY